MSGAVPWAALPPFDSLGAQARRAVEGIAAPHSLRTGKALFWQGDRAEAAYLVVSGTLRGVMYRSDESSLEMGRHGAGEWLGLAECILGAPYLSDAVAEEPCSLAAFPRPGLERLLALPGMERFFLREVARRYCTLHSRIECNNPLDRLARYLLERADAQGDEVACTQEDIAQAIGVTRETVNRHLGRLQEEGLVVVGRGSVRVASRDSLRARAGAR
jgi:CRP/FNR family transcriptional regulator, cyclic AMP receptor protein